LGQPVLAVEGVGAGSAVSDWRSIAPAPVGNGRENRMAFIFRLELADGTPSAPLNAR